jgi:hypothetical protein
MGTGLNLGIKSNDEGLLEPAVETRKTMTPTSSTRDKPSAGDPIPSKCAVIEVHVGELKLWVDACSSQSVTLASNWTSSSSVASKPLRTCDRHGPDPPMVTTNLLEQNYSGCG